MVKRCCYGICNTDSRYPERLEDGVTFIPFPKPTTKLEKCQRWIRLCGRAHDQLNVTILQQHSKAKHFYVCSKHFIEGHPTLSNPDPVPAIVHDKITPVRPPPKPRALSEPPKKRVRVALDESFRLSDNGAENIPVQSAAILDKNIGDQKENYPQAGEQSLEILALAAENERLKRSIEKLIIENESHIQKNRNCERKSQPRPVELLMSTDRLRLNKKKDEFKYYTGLTHEQFCTFFKFLVPCENPFKMSKTVKSRDKLKMEDQLLMVMMKLRQNFDFCHIGTLFGISQPDASVIFTNWIQYMFYRCGSISIWPHRDTIIENMPLKYKEEFPNSMVIIDGTELKIQRPSSMTRQSQCYSDYKSCNTLKGLVGIDPRGSVIFASMLFGGSISDKELTEQSGFYRVLGELKKCGKLIDGDGVMVDKGFRIKEEIESLGLCLNIPPFAMTGTQMSMSDISLTEKIARHRVHVERAIARIKNFKILSQRIDLSHFSKIDQIWFVCCFATNFMNFLIKM